MDQGTEHGGVMRQTLYQISGDFLALDAILEECGGDVSAPGAVEALDAMAADLRADLSRKLDGWHGYLAELEMRAVRCRAEAERWATEARSLEARHAGSKRFVQGCLEAAGQTKVLTDGGRTFAIVGNGGAAPVILADGLDPATVPDELCTVTRVVNKSAVAKALAAGESLPWAAMGNRGSSLRIR